MYSEQTPDRPHMDDNNNQFLKLFCHACERFSLSRIFLKGCSEYVLHIRTSCVEQLICMPFSTG